MDIDTHVHDHGMNTSLTRTLHDMDTSMSMDMDTSMTMVTSKIMAKSPFWPGKFLKALNK